MVFINLDTLLKMSSKDIVLYNTDLLFLITDYLDDKSSNNLFNIDRHHDKMLFNNSHRYTIKNNSIVLDEYMDIYNLEDYRDYFSRYYSSIKKIFECKNATIDVICNINFLIDYDNTIYYEEDEDIIPENWNELINLHGSMTEYFSSIFPDRTINITFKDEYNKKFVCSSHEESATVNITIYINNYHYEEN